MTPAMKKLSSLLAALLLVVSSCPVPVQAITNGFPDTNNTFSNVGTVLAVGTDGQAFQIWLRNVNLAHRVPGRRPLFLLLQ